MQAVNQEQPFTSNNQSTIVLQISAEFIAYTVLIILAFLLRVADLDIVPMSVTEATQALSAYQVFHDETPAQPQAAQSPIVYWLQVLSFSTFGGDEFASRLPGVLGGMILVFMPLVFRSRIGRERAFWLSVLFAFSPIAFASARFTDPTLWTIIFALAFLWSIWRYWDNRQVGDVLLAAGFLGAMVFLSESGGLLLALILTLAGFAAIWWTVMDAPEDRDTPGDDVMFAVRDFIGSIPLSSVAMTFAATVILGSTLFFTNPSGMNMVAELISQTFAGFVQPYQADTPPIMAVFTLFVYDFWLLVLAIIATSVLVINHTLDFVDRFAIATVAIGLVILIIYRGSEPAHALYLAVPMMWLVARLISELTVNYTPVWFAYDGYEVNNENVSYWWIKWILAVIIVGILVMLNMHWLEVGRGLLELPSGGLWSALTDGDRSSALKVLAGFSILVMFSIFLVVGYFLAASIWGNINSLQGYGLGLVLFMLGAGIGAGWNTAVVNATNPYELWHNSAVTADAYLLRDTLHEIADRDSKGFPLIDVTILRDESTGITDDSVLAWLLRDFQNAAFVDTLDDARRDEIVLLPVFEEDPDLGGSYVGQSFVIRQHWTIQDLRANGWFAWLGQRRVQGDPALRDTTILWLRIDVYDGIPASERIQR